MSTLFKALSIEEEHEILHADDAKFSGMQKYIESYILQALSHFDADEGEKSIALKNLIDIIPVAAKRFVENRSTEDMKFSTYFGWYISEEVKKYTWERTT